MAKYQSTLGRDNTDVQACTNAIGTDCWEATAHYASDVSAFWGDLHCAVTKGCKVGYLGAPPPNLRGIYAATTSAINATLAAGSPFWAGYGMPHSALKCDASSISIPCSDAFTTLRRQANALADQLSGWKPYF